MRTTSVARPHLDEAKRTEASLTKNHKEGQDYSKRKSDNEILGKLLEQTIYSRKAASVFNCARLLEFLVAETIDNEVVLLKYHAYHCDFRYCPICQHRHSIRYFARIMNAAANLQASYRKLKPILLTLTVPNCDVTNLRETIEKLNNSFKKLTRNSVFPGKAWIKSVEITRAFDWYNGNKYLGRHGKKWAEGRKTILRAVSTDEVHPHIHVLLLVSPSYFGPGYWKHERWLTEWRKATGDDRITQVDVRRVRGKQPEGNQNTFESDLAAGVVEVAKYCVKSADLVTEDTSPAFLEELISETKDLKFITFGGLFRKFLSETLQSEDKEETLEIRKSWLELYQYHSKLKDYLLIETRSKTSSN